MKAILVIDMPDDLDITLEDIKTEITLSSKDETKSMLYLKYGRVKLKPMPQRKYEGNRWTEYYDVAGDYLKAQGYNKCIDEILGEGE